MAGDARSSNRRRATQVRVLSDSGFTPLPTRPLRRPTLSSCFWRQGMNATADGSDIGQNDAEAPTGRRRFISGGLALGAALATPGAFAQSTRTDGSPAP